ncbi:MAG: [FeFe] hydrogenase H-cluster radical SAM maturase HydG [Candidatus Brocadiia bacterium]
MPDRATPVMEYTSTFLDEAAIHSALARAAAPDHALISDVLAKAAVLKGLTMEEAAVLLNATEPHSVEAIFAAARDAKKTIYGSRIVLFAPLYLSNFCVNNCLYCGFRVDNKDLARVALDKAEIEEETRILLKQGHKRVLLVTGQTPKYSSLDYIEMAVKAVYSMHGPADSRIRRINVNAAPMSVEDFKRLKSFGIGTYQCFQETYHRETYRVMHPSGPKASYDWRVTAMHRALEAGIDDVGIGALFGLYDHRFETLATIMHAQALDKTFNIGPHTVSIPRLEPALNAPAAMNPPARVGDDDMKLIVAVLRLALPYTGIILSTREAPELRDEMIRLGVSQISAGSRTNPGGYKDAESNDECTEQFVVADTRNMDQIINALVKMGMVPSMCTACYRLGRTGERFMEEAKSGHIHTYCLPNAILTFKEYLMDFASPQTKTDGEKTIREQVAAMAETPLKHSLVDRLERIEKGERDLYF